MTELHHFHPARKGSGSLRPFPIYPLYTQTVILSLDKPIADCFLFRPRKSRKSAGNAVIPTFPTHWSHGLQHLRHKRRNVRFNRLRRVHTPPQPLTAHTAAYTAKQGRFGWGWYHYPRTVLRGSEPLRAQRLEEHSLPSLHGPRERRKEAESLRNGDAHRARLRSEAPRPRRVAPLHCCFLRCTSKLRGSLSLRRRAERKIC